MNLKEYIASVPNYPKEGIIFRDISPLMANGKAYQYATQQIVDYARKVGAEMIVGPEARGFIVGCPVAYELGIGFAPARKKGKLPRETVAVEYDLEYGSAELHLHKDAVKPGQKVLICDDLLATGGTMAAAAKLVEKLGGEVVGLVGKNGAGKSTLLKVVSGVMKATKGKVIAHGNISPMIELGAGFDFNLTAKENIYLNGAILGYSESLINEKFEEIVEFSELRSFLDVPVKNFSSGMIAKLAFSIATIIDPEILIVDEILSVGDIQFQEKSKRKMLEMIKGGTTVLYVSHSLDSIKDLCSKAIWLENGQVVMIDKAKKVCDQYYKKTMGE